MSFLKNRTVIGVICIVLSLIICFAITPLFNQQISQKVEIIRVISEITIGDEITANMVKVVEVGGYNLPQDVLKNTKTVIGKYATADMVKGDYILSSKIADEPVAENEYLYSLDGEKQAISVSVKSFANGLSGKLKSGDIVSVIAPDYKKQGITIIPQELQYVEVIAVTAGSGYDANTSVQSSDFEEQEKELPSTITLLVDQQQGNILAELEVDGKLHISLVYRGDKEITDKFIEAQKITLDALYAEVTEESTESSMELLAEESIENEETDEIVSTLDSEDLDSISSSSESKELDEMPSRTESEEADTIPLESEDQS